MLGMSETTPVLFPVLLGTCEAAESLGVSRVTIARQVKAGNLTPAHTLPGRGGYVFTAEEIERFRTAPRRRKPYTRRGEAA